MRFFSQQIEKIKNKKFNIELKAKNKMCAITAGLASAIAANPLVSSATTNPPSTSSTATSDNIMTNVTSVAFTMFKYIGFFLLVWGVGQLVLAYRNDDSDSKVRAIMAIATGAALFGLESFFKTLGISL